MPLKSLKSFKINIKSKSRYVNNLVEMPSPHPPTQAYKCDVTNAERTVEVFAHIDRDLDPVTGLVLASRTVSCQIVS
jgi:hypothetical protein